MNDDNTRSNAIRTFGEVTEADQPMAGGKGGTLSRLYKLGYPVPEGFIVFPVAFINDEISENTWQQVKNGIANLRRTHTDNALAIRSSAVAEDSAIASFAGEFETILNLHSDEEIRAAINVVRKSRHNERVKAYSQAQGVPILHEMSVIIQRLVKADISGVLFTADPLTGNRNLMTGNYIYGFGDKLVSGEVTPIQFTVERLRYKYNGPSELKSFARKLYKLALRLERSLGSPQDVVVEGRIGAQVVKMPAHLRAAQEQRAPVRQIDL